jgi:hypothetical protein
MAKEKKAGKKIPSAKEKILATVKEQLTTSLTSLKSTLGEKKFKKRIKKAAKKLVAGIKNKPVKKTAVKKKATVLPKKKATKTILKKAKKK